MSGDYRAMWEALLPVGRDTGTGGYRRFAWSDADLTAREWFTGEAAKRGLDVHTDRNGNLWAWWHCGDATQPAFVTGSHLDSVPDGGAYDGPLGVVSAFAAVDLLRARGLTPARPVAIAAFSDEEGARFGVACAGSRLATGVLSPDRARGLRDADGTTLEEAMRRAGHDPSGLGRDDETLARIGVYVELHIEQGRGLIDLGAPVALASRIHPHGRWRFSFTGRADHAGTTRLEDRRDPMLTYAMTALAARKAAGTHGCLATFGRVRVEPNAVNAVPSAVHGWLDARAADEHVLGDVVARIREQAEARALRDGTALHVSEESRTPVVVFPDDVRTGLAAALEPQFGAVPVLATGAGHDAGVLAAEVPSAMLFVRNPTGMSHTPEEYAEESDCLSGVEALATVMHTWAGK